MSIYAGNLSYQVTEDELKSVFGYGKVNRVQYSSKPNKNQYRKRKGGTITNYGFRSGDLVKAEQAGKTYIGWIGGYSNKNKVVNWKRIGQFTYNKVTLLKRKTGNNRPSHSRD